MNEPRMDIVVRQMAAGHPRRTVVSLLISAVIAATTPPLPVDAKKKKKKKKGGSGGGECKALAQEFAKVQENACLAKYNVDLADAAECSLCYDFCATEFYAICEFGTGDFCAGSCDDIYGIDTLFPKK